MAGKKNKSKKKSLPSPHRAKPLGARSHGFQASDSRRGGKRVRHSEGFALPDSAPSSTSAQKRAKRQVGVPSPCPSSPATRLGRLRGVRSVLPRVVPWRDWAEWDEVRVGLTGSDGKAAACAIGRVRAWQSRGKVPHSIEATAALVEIGLSQGFGDSGEAAEPDRSGRSREPVEAGRSSEAAEAAQPPRSIAVPARSENELRLMYSMALVRLVNGIVDAVQEKKFATAVTDIAAKLALPRILVDIRHAATHNALPTLAALKVAAERALHWLQQHYWLPQAHMLDTCSASSRSLEPLLGEYARVRRQFLRVLRLQLQEEEEEEGEEEVLQDAMHEANARNEQDPAHLQNTAQILLERIARTVSSGGLDVAHTLLLPLIQTTCHLLREQPPPSSGPTSSSSSNSSSRAPTRQASATSASAASASATYGSPPGVVLSEGEEELEERVEEAIAVWDEAVDYLQDLFPSFRAAFTACLTSHLKLASLFTCHHASLFADSEAALQSEKEPSGHVQHAKAASAAPGKGGAGVACVAGIEREWLVCLVCRWLQRLLTRTRLLLTPTTEHVRAAASISHAAACEGRGHALGGGLQMLQSELLQSELREVVRGCLGAPCVWTRRLLPLVLPLLSLHPIPPTTPANGKGAGNRHHSNTHSSTRKRKGSSEVEAAEGEPRRVEGDEARRVEGEARGQPTETATRLGEQALLLHCVLQQVSGGGEEGGASSQVIQGGASMRGASINVIPVIRGMHPPASAASGASVAWPAGTPTTSAKRAADGEEGEKSESSQRESSERAPSPTHHPQHAHSSGVAGRQSAPIAAPDNHTHALYHRLHAQLLAWQTAARTPGLAPPSFAPSLAPLSPPPPPGQPAAAAAAAAAGGPGGGGCHVAHVPGAWRRVSSWQPAPIGVILGQVERLDLQATEATEASLHFSSRQGLVGSNSNSNQFNAQSHKSKAAGAEGGEGGAAEGGAVCRVVPSEPSEATHRSPEAAYSHNTYSYRSGEPLHAEKRDADLEEWAGETRGIGGWSRKGQQTSQEEECGEWDKRRAGSGKGGEESEAQSWLKVSGLLRRHSYRGCSMHTEDAATAAAAAACAQRLHKEASVIRLLS